MKKQILLLFLVLGCCTSFAQPVITHAEDYQIGMKYVSNAVDTAGLTIGPSGANVTWNFSSLQISADTFTTLIVHPDSTAYSGMFPNASYAMVNDGVTNMIQEAGDTSFIAGVIPGASGLVIAYNDPYAFIKRPITYLDTLIDAASRHYSVSGENFTGAGMGMTVADGWGTLMLPGQTYNDVLRVRYMETFYDTGSISGIITLSTVTSYNWFDADHISPLMRVDSIIVANDFFADTTVVVWMLKYEQLPVGVQEHGALPASKLYYADGSLFLAGDLHVGDKVTVEVYDMVGRKVIEHSQQLKSDVSRYMFSLRELNECAQYVVSVAIERDNEVYRGKMKVVK